MSQIYIKPIQQQNQTWLNDINNENNDFLTVLCFNFHIL